MKVEVVMDSPVRSSSYGLCGPKATLNRTGIAVRAQELCVKVGMAVLGSPSLIVLTVSVGVKQH